MRKQIPKLEWQVVENDAEWERQQALLSPTEAAHTGNRLQQYAGTVIGFLLLLALGGAWWQQPSQTENQPRTVGVGQSSQQQTLPDASLWGSEQSWATPYFLYHFRQHDAAVVRAVAPLMDELYTTQWRNLGLPLSSTADRLLVKVTLEQLPGQAPLIFDTQHPVNVAVQPLDLAPGDPPTEPVVMPSVSVPSPARYLASGTPSDEELLAQSIALPLLAQGMAQARDQYQIGPAWQPLLDGLYLSQLWDLDLPLAAWRETVVQWQYRAVPAAQLGAALPLPREYQEFCAMHKLWLQSPVQIHIPLVCPGKAWEDPNWAMWRARSPLTTLSQLAVPSPMTWDGGESSLLGAPFYSEHPGQTVALATLIEYAVHTYGRESLPGLLAELGGADSWETLIPAAFGISTAEFEAGWQAYLAAQYGIALDTAR